MRFLLDQDAYAATARHLRLAGYDVVTTANLGLVQATDEEILVTAGLGQKVLVTRDRDFGALVFVRGLHVGVIYLRILPSNSAQVHTELDRVLTKYTFERLRFAFVVVEADGHRFRRIG